MSVVENAVNPYAKRPLREDGGIPVFSETDPYVANYERIAKDHIAAIKPGQGNPFMGDELWAQLEESTRTLLKKYVSPGSKVLDVGVGMGRLLDAVPEYDRYGMDISREYLEVAKSKGIEVALARIEDMPYLDGYFDAVVTTDVLEHVFDLHRCCEQILRALRPGGVLIVRVPYREDLSPYLSPELPYDFVHLRSFDEYSLQLLFCKILNCVHVEHQEAVAYLQGAARLRVRLLKEGSPTLKSLRSSEPARGSGKWRLKRAWTALKAVWDDRPRIGNRADPYKVLRSLAETDEEELIEWIYWLRDEHPGVFAQVAPDLVMGIDINMVLRKRQQS